MADNRAPLAAKISYPSKLQPHWALALYLVAATVTTWAAFADDSLGHRHFVSFFDVTAGFIEFYIFLLLAVINYRHDFMLIGKIVLMMAIFLCVGLSLYILYQFVTTLRSPAYQTVFLQTIIDNRGYVTSSILPLAAATAAFVGAMLMLTRTRPRFSPAKSPSVLAINTLNPDSYEPLPLDSSLPATETNGASRPFQSRRSTDVPEVKSDDDQNWSPALRQTRN